MSLHALKISRFIYSSRRVVWIGILQINMKVHISNIYNSITYHTFIAMFMCFKITVFCFCWAEYSILSVCQFSWCQQNHFFFFLGNFMMFSCPFTFNLFENFLGSLYLRLVLCKHCIVKCYFFGSVLDFKHFWSLVNTHCKPYKSLYFSRKIKEIWEDYLLLLSDKSKIEGTSTEGINIMSL